MRRALVLLATLLAAGLPARADEPGQKEFEAATALEGRGDYAGAAAALETLGRDQPQSSYADDALFEAAVIAEEHLSDPTRAARLYLAVATQYPSSRLSRRARTRSDFLASSLKTGEGPLREYQDILREYAHRPPADSIARMEQLVREHPDFALADRALYWLGSTEAEQRHDARAMTWFAEVERRFPGGEWAQRSKKARGDLLLRAGRAAEAAQVYRELGQSGDLLARAAAHEGLNAVSSAVQRKVALWIAVAYLVAFLLLHVVTLRRLRASLKPTREVLFYLPVAVLFMLAAATENGAIAAATASIAVGGGLIVWAACAVTAARLERGTLPIRARVGRLAASAVAVLSVMYIAVQTNGLTDLMIETLRAGPER